METQLPRVLVFDDYESNGRYPYRDMAVQTATEAGWSSIVFGDARSADRFITEPGTVQAVVSSLGTRDKTSFGYQFPAMPLLQTAVFHRLPVALLSSHLNANRHLHPEKGDIVVPKQPYERIRPLLQAWFSRIAAGHTV